MKKFFTVELLVSLGTVLFILLCGLVLLKLRPLWQPVFDVAVTILAPFFLASFITYLLHPLVEILHRKGVPRSLAILFIYFMFFGGTGFFIFKSIPYLIHQLKDLSEQLPTLSETYKHWIREFYEHTDHLPEVVHSEFEDMLQSIERYLHLLIASILGVLVSFWKNLFTWVVIPFLVFYMLKDLDQIFKLIRKATPKSWRDPGVKLVKDIDVSLGNYIRGQLTVAVSLAAMAVFSFWIADVPYPVIMGIIIGITDFIPYFGPLLGAVPVALIAITISTEKLLIVVAILIVLQFIEGNILGPLIVGKTLHIHPIVIIFALLIGGEIAGVVGLIFAVPVFAVGRVIYIHTRQHFRNVDNVEK